MYSSQNDKEWYQITCTILLIIIMHDYEIANAIAAPPPPQQISYHKLDTRFLHI